jgi:putative ABC transport system substrate-binding protein
MAARERRDMNRRAFLWGSATLLATPLATHAQEPRGARTVRIGRLSPLSARTDTPNLDAFRRGLRDLGWVEGQSFTIQARFADGKADRLPGLAAELVRDRVDIILVGSSPGALAAKGATTSIPIVMVTTGDPVGDGIVVALARPGGNITGVTALNTKRLELIKEAVPGVARVAVLLNPASQYTASFLSEREAAARGLGLDLRLLEARDPAMLDRVLAAPALDGVGALMIQTDALFITHRQRIVELVAKSRVPTVYSEREFIDAGGLMFYGASLVEMYREAATYADKILKGWYARTR